jgi:ABC-type lipoprotein export system ATPase subunit
MKYKNFIIENFKGIEKIELDLSNNRIMTLVGLNESGKTTIMEAIKIFYDLIKGKNINEIERNNFRPKGIDFTGIILLSSNMMLEVEDLTKLNTYITNLNLPYTFNIRSINFNYSFKFTYNLHNFKKKETETTFEIDIKVKNESGKYINHKLSQYDNSQWQNILKYLKEELIPEILYYEDFVFNIPEEIEYISADNVNMANTPNIEKNRIWQLVLDDIIKVVNPQFTSFNEMVVQIWGKDNDTALNRISQLEQVLNEKITKSWKDLFKNESRSVNFKEIKIVAKPDTTGLKFSFKVKTEDGKLFSINDRSKGCRWFFSFLIFTEFRKNRTKNILFLLDEPASNLHSSAQNKILDAIEELSHKAVVIYSTHSHHLINPKWLSGAYVVINDILSDAMLRGEMTFQETSKISLIKYFHYVGQGKGSTNFSYFQPILDALDYSPSVIEPIPNIVLTEGKNDWYGLNYINEIILEKTRINFYPGSGRESLWNIIRLYLAWGKNFIVILDGDSPGIESKNQYTKEFSPFLDNKVFTFKDCLNSFGNFEDLFTTDDIQKIILAHSPLDVFDKVKGNKKKVKELFNASINRLYFNKTKIEVSEDTKKRFSTLFNFINVKLESLKAPQLVQ